MSPESQNEYVMSPESHNEDVMSPESHNEDVMSPESHNEYVMSPESHNGSQWVLIMCWNHTRILNSSRITQWIRNVSRITQ